MTGNNTVRAIVSPLTRCIRTSLLVSKNLPISQFSIEEDIRETLGEDTCDARRSASDPDSSKPFTGGPCQFEEGLRTKFPQVRVLLRVSGRVLLLALVRACAWYFWYGAGFSSEVRAAIKRRPEFWLHFDSSGNIDGYTCSCCCSCSCLQYEFPVVGKTGDGFGLVR